LAGENERFSGKKHWISACTTVKVMVDTGSTIDPVG